MFSPSRAKLLLPLVLLLLALLGGAPGTASGAIVEVGMTGGLSASGGEPWAPVNTGSSVNLFISASGVGQGTVHSAMAAVTLPGGLTPGAMPAGCSYSAPTITCSFGDVGTYGSVTKTVPVTVTTAGHHLMTASFTHNDLDFYQPQVVTLDVEAVSATTVRIGMNLPYVQDTWAGAQLTISAADMFYNQGPGVAHAATATYKVPTGWTYVSSTIQGTVTPCAYAGATRLVTCSFGDVATGAGNKGMSIVVTAGPAVTSVSHEFTVASSDTDYDPTDNARVATNKVHPAGATNLYTSGGLSTGAFTYKTGDSMGGIVDIGNFGPNNATGVSVTISGNIPGVTFSSVTPTGATCSALGGTSLTCTPTGGALSGANGFARIEFVLAAGAAGQFNLTAAMSANQADTNTAMGSQTTVVTSTFISNAAHADVSSYVSPANASPAPGASTYLTASISNAGPAAAAGSQLVVTLPPNANYVSQVIEYKAGNSGTCGAYVAASRTITCTVGTLAKDGVLQLRVNVTAGANGNGTFQSAATTTTAQSSTTYDNGQAPWRVHSADADLKVETIYTPATVKVGDVVTLRATISNPQGATFVLDNAANVAVTDNLPAGWTAQSVQTGSGSCSGVGTATVSCTGGSVAVNGSYRIYVTALVGGTAGVKLNQATVTSASSSEVDPSNNTASTSITVQSTSADLEAEIQSSPGALQGGAPYTVSGLVRNHGGLTATSVVTTFQLPAGDVLQSATMSGSSCTSSTSMGTTTVTCPIASLASGATASFSVTANARTAAGTLAFTATTSSAVADPDAANNVDAANVTVLPPAVADLKATMTPTPEHGSTTITLGERGIWQVKVRNDGGATANATLVTLHVPAGSNAFATACTGSAPTLLCDLGNIPPGGEATRDLSVYPAAVGTINVSMSSTSSTTEQNAADNDAADATFNVIEPDSADLTITNRGNPAPVTVGQDATLTFDVENVGDDAAATHVTATLPAGLAYVSSTATQGSCAQVAQVLDCNLGTVAGVDVVGAPDATVTLVVASATPGLYVVPAEVASTTADPDVAGNTASASATVTGIGVDFAIKSITTAAKTFSVGAGIDYAITVRNNGPQADSGVLSVALPAGSSFTSSSITAGTCDAAPVGGVLTCGVGPLAAGVEAVVHVVVSPATTADKTLSATIDTVAIPDDVPGNDSGSRTVAYGGAVVGATGSLAFVPQLVGSTSGARVVNVTNSGGAAAAFTSATLGGADAGDFALTTTCAGSILAASTCTVAVTFTPTVAGDRAATLTVVTSDPVQPTIVLPVTGTGSSTALAATGSLAFGERAVGAGGAARSVTVTNAGTASATPVVALGGAAAGDYALTTTCGAALAPGAGCDVSLTFVPSATGARDAQVTVDGAPGSSPLVVPVSGTGVPGAGAVVLPVDTDGDGLPDGVDCAPRDPKRPARGGRDANCNGVLDSRDPRRLIGTARANLLLGGPAGDFLAGRGGNDTLRGAGGNDRLFGDAGHDKLFGDAGDDDLRGGAGNDVLNGGAGKDKLLGEAGNDTLVGGPGKDVLDGGVGADRINAKDGKPGDVVRCGTGADQVIADKGDTVARDCERRVTRFGR